MNTYDITALRGDTFAGLKFSLQSYAEGATTPTPIDLTGSQIKMQVRRLPDDTEVVLEFSTNDASIVIEGIANNVIYVKPKLVPSSAPTTRCHYDVQINFPNGEVKTYIRGNFEILKDVTK
jgi:hypothetical protein